MSNYELKTGHIVYRKDNGFSFNKIWGRDGRPDGFYIGRYIDGNDEFYFINENKDTAELGYGKIIFFPHPEKINIQERNDGLYASFDNSDYQCVVYYKHNPFVGTAKGLKAHIIDEAGQYPFPFNFDETWKKLWNDTRRSEGLHFMKAPEPVPCVPYQLCPKCNGEGEFNIPHTSHLHIRICPVCMGKRIIPMHVLNQQINNESKEINLDGSIKGSSRTEEGKRCTCTRTSHP